MPDATLNLNSADKALDLSKSQTGDVNAERVAGRDVTHIEGVDPAPVIDLLGGRLERQLERIGEILTWFLMAIALMLVGQVFTLALWGSTVYYLLQPHLVAGR